MIMEPLVNSRSPHAQALRPSHSEFTQSHTRVKNNLRILKTRFPKFSFFFFFAEQNYFQEGYLYFTEKNARAGRGQWECLSS